MSSLMQFGGETRKNPKTGRGEVGLEFERYISDTSKKISECYLDPKVPCTICGKEHGQIGVAWRQPRGMWGAWVVFEYLGGKHAPDLSVPISVPTWPKGTHVLTQEENSKNWHRED